VRSVPPVNVIGLSGFSGYKVGMTHVMAIEADKYSNKKGEEVAIPVTVVECPPMKIVFVRFYSIVERKRRVSKDIFVARKDKFLSKRIKIPTKKHSLDVNIDEFVDVSVLVSTMPHKTGIGKKNPEIFEMPVTGKTISEKFEFVKSLVDKEINVEDVFKEGEYVDLKSVTKGKGFQGPVKRFGISIGSHKSEKSIRHPGSLGGWKGHGHFMWRISHAGKMGYHRRTEYNKQIISIQKPKDILVKGGYLNYGFPKNNCLLVKGSISGSRKRLIIFQKSMRLIKRKKTVPTLVSVSTESKQGV